MVACVTRIEEIAYRHAFAEDMLIGMNVIGSFCRQPVPS
jgi:hypothetical protein